MLAAVRAELTEPLAFVQCIECGRLGEDDETWHLRFADIAEVVIYCPTCAEREFGAEPSEH